VFFFAQTIAKLLNKFIQVCLSENLSTSSSSTHTHCLINFLKNASEGFSEVDAHSIEPCIFCNHFFLRLQLNRGLGSRSNLLHRTKCAKLANLCWFCEWLACKSASLRQGKRRLQRFFCLARGFRIYLFFTRRAFAICNKSSKCPDYLRCS